MFCYNCGCQLSEKDFCTGCGADVGLYKRIMYSANRFYNNGLEKAAVRDLSGAISSLRQCLKLNKNHIEARNLLGLVYFERGEVVAALSEWVISKNIQNEKNIADDYINMIQDNPGRLEAFNQTVKKYNLVLNYCEQGSFDLAVIQLRKILSNSPRFVQARQLLALLYIHDGDWEKAKKELDKALQIDVNNTTTLRYMKEVEAMLPPQEERGKKKKEAVVYQSGNDTVIQPASKKEIIGWQTLVNIVIGVVIGVAMTYYLIRPSRLQQDREEMTVKYKEVSEQLDAKNVQVNEMQMQINELNKEKESLSTSLDEAQGTSVALEANTKLIEAALMYLNKTGDEMAVAEALEKITPEYIEASASESFKGLYSAVKEAVGPTVSKKSYPIGFDAFHAEDYETAIRELTKAYEYDPKNGDALYNLGNSYNKRGDTDKAIEIYEQVVELFPNTTKARKSQNYIKEIRGE